MAITCTAASLASAAACFTGLSPVQKEAVKVYLLAVAAGITPDPATIVAAAKCFEGLSQAQFKAAQTYLLCQISTGSSCVPWVRPLDWLTIPTIASTEEKFIGLLAVTNDDANYIALSAAGNYHVDWGDGTNADVATGVQSNHQYTYSAISNSTLTSRGYKQVLVTITAQAGQHITNINLQKKNTTVGLSAYTAQWLDMTLNSPTLTSLSIGGTTVKLAWMEQCVIQTIGVVASAAGLFQNCFGLQSLPVFDTSAVTSFANFFNGCVSLRAVPLLNTASGTSFNSMFLNCFSMESVPLLNTAAGTNFVSMFNDCFALQVAPLFNTAAGTDFTGMFQFCYSLQSIAAMNTAAGTTFTNMFGSINNLSVGVLTGTTKTISYLGCKLSQQAIVDIFNALGVAVAQTITVTTNPGATLLTAPQIAIATGKGWTVVT